MTDSGKVTVIGAGLMGVGIAHAFALSGSFVTLVDVSQERVTSGVNQIGRLFMDGVKIGKLDDKAAAAASARVAGALSIPGDNAALLVETATERLDIKHAILREADALLPAETIFATNTSALSITEIASVTGRADRVVGMHFFNPVHKMKLVEIIRGLETSAATLAATREWVNKIGKTSIVVNEAPGFTTSRMSALMGNEAMTMLAEGVATAEDIDTSLRMAFNHPMGPLELGDLTGWDTRLSVLQYLHTTLGEKFRPSPLIIKMVKSGRHGRKTGRGVYEYDESGKKIDGSGLRVF